MVLQIKHSLQIKEVEMVGNESTEVEVGRRPKREV
jgi:hypothetical protein